MSETAGFHREWSESGAQNRISAFAISLWLV